MKLNLIFLTNKAFTDRDYFRFGIKFFQLNKFNVMIWDLSQMNTLELDYYYEVETKNIKITKFSNIEQISNQKKNLKNSYIFDLRAHHVNQVNLSLNWFKKKGCKIIKLETGLLPSYKITNYERIKYIIFHLNPKLIKDKIKRDLRKITYSKKTNSQEYDLHICTGINTEYKYNCRMLYSHSFDYDTYIRESKFKTKTINDYIVFVDNGACDHPDYKLLGQIPTDKADTYYPKINEFFQRIEKIYNKKIIICSHPRIRDIKKTSKLFGNRKTIIDKTSEYIRNSFLVLIHDSTAISFAVLWKKPLIFVSSNEMKRNRYFVICHILKSLNIKDYNIDKINNNFNFEYESKKALHRYLYYKNTYIKHPKSVSKLSCEILSDYLLSNINF